LVYSKLYKKTVKLLQEKANNNNAKIKNIKEKYFHTKTHREDYFNHVNKFITKLEKLIPSNTNINSEDVYLVENTYIINHDHNGYTTSRTFTLAGNKVLLKNNHSFFNTDVLYYINKKTNISVYYDAQSLLLLGYKISNQPFKYSERKNVFIKRIQSVKNMLLSMGYYSTDIDISEDIEDIKENYYKVDDKFIINKITNKYNKSRFDNLKKVVRDTNKILYCIKNNYYVKDEDYNQIVEKYNNKLKGLILKNTQGSQVFNDWKAYTTNLLFNKPKPEDIKIKLEKLVNYSEFTQYDYHGNLLLYYLIDNMTKLLEYNDRKLQMIIAYLAIDIIIYEYKLFNNDNTVSNYSTRLFNYILDSTTFVDIGVTDEDFETNIYGEYVDPDEEISEEEKERIMDSKEEDDALDVEVNEDGEDIDYEIDYASGVNMG
jgi:hypothetical protein